MTLDSALATVLVGVLSAAVTLLTLRATTRVQGKTVAVAGKAEARQEAKDVVDGALDLVTGIRDELNRLRDDLTAERGLRERADKQVAALSRRVEALEEENARLHSDLDRLRRIAGPDAGRA